MPQRRKADGPGPLKEAQFPPDYSIGAETVRGHIANSLQILQAVLADLHEQHGEPFLPGLQDDLRGVQLRLEHALARLDTRP